jgi:uncharacterized protein
VELILAHLAEEEKQFGFSLDPAWIRDALPVTAGSVFTVTRAHPIDIRARRVGLDVLLSADFSLSLDTECSLCVREIALTIPVRFTLTLQPKPALAPLLPDEVELNPEDPDDYYFEGDSIDLDGILREQLILALPMYPKCTEDCRGLCPVCGIDLNASSCSCERDDVDPRWEKLKLLTREQKG